MRGRKIRRLTVAAVVLGVATTTASVSSAGVPDGNSGGGSADWVGSWATGMAHGNATGSTNAGFNNQSVRLIVRPTVGGNQIRIRLSNIYGDGPITIGHATVALPNNATPEQSDINPNTLRQLTFNGATQRVAPKGTELLSDPVDMAIDDFQTLVVSVYFPAPTGPTTFHGTSRQLNFVGATDLTNEAGGAGYTITRTCCWFFLSGVDVLRHKANGAVVVLGDSIADGSGTTMDANKRWPDLLAERLVDVTHNGKVPSVLNVGMAGNRLTHDGPEPLGAGIPGFNELGVSALARLNEDVFPQAGVRTVITHLGINDIWMSNDSADTIVAALLQINQQIKQRGLRSVVATLSPFEGLATVPGAWTPEKEATRVAVNAALRASTEFDGLIDFDALLRDPAAPSKLLPAYDSGDHIHPNDLANQVMADSIALNLVR